jgi:PBP1b-binding outer membrane lipoprotein LpoB
MKKMKSTALITPLCACMLLSGCMEEGRMSPEEEDADVVDPGVGNEESSEENTD